MNIRPTDLSLLVSLDTLLELKNVTRAAKRLHISQPALSSQLARLRVLFNDPLLTPSETGRGMVATPRATEMAAPLREAIEKLSLVGQTHEAGDDPPREVIFNVAGNDESISALAPRLIRQVHNQRFGGAPLRLCFVQAKQDSLLSQFESGEIDLLLGTSANLPLGLRMRKLCEDRHVMVQRRDHPRGCGLLTMADYCALQHAHLKPAGHDGLVIDECLRRSGHKRHIGVQLPQWSMLREVLLETDMVATVPATLLASGVADDSLECFELPFSSPAMPLAMVWHRRSDNDPIHRWLRERHLDIAPPLQRQTRVARSTDPLGIASDRLCFAGGVQ